MAIHSHPTFKEHVTWDASMVVLPNGQGLAPAIAVFLGIPGLVLGEMAQTFSILPIVGHTEEAVNKFVYDAVEAMLGARSEQAQKALTGEASPGGQPGSLVLP